MRSHPIKGRARFRLGSEAKILLVVSSATPRKMPATGGHGEHWLRPCPTRCDGDHRRATALGLLLSKSKRSRVQSSLSSICQIRQTKHFNDPSAGSPTETLLRLLLPPNAKVWASSQHRGSLRIPRPQSEALTVTFNR